jgi:hypothetical protein
LCPLCRIPPQRPLHLIFSQTVFPVSTYALLLDTHGENLICLWLLLDAFGIRTPVQVMMVRFRRGASAAPGCCMRHSTCQIWSEGRRATSLRHHLVRYLQLTYRSIRNFTIYQRSGLAAVLTVDTGTGRHDEASMYDFIMGCDNCNHTETGISFGTLSAPWKPNRHMSR